MKAGVYHGFEDVRIENVHRPATPRDGLLLRVKACGLCGTDVAKYRHRLVEPPVVLGHEVAGEIVEVGPDAEGWREGDRIIVPHHIPCFVCPYCRHGNVSACETFRPTNIAPGGFCEYMSVAGLSTRKGVLRIPESVTFDQAALCESLACCLRAFKRSATLPGDSMAVIGCGPVGLMHLLLASAMGAGTLIGLDLVPERLEAAKRHGASLALDPRDEATPERVREATGGCGADVVMVCVGNAAAIETAFRIVRRGGQVHVFAESPPGAELALDPNTIYHETALVGTYSSAPADQVEAMRLIADRRVDLEQLVTHRLPLDELQHAFDLAVEGTDALKILINP